MFYIFKGYFEYFYIEKINGAVYDEFAYFKLVAKVNSLDSAKAILRLCGTNV